MKLKPFDLVTAIGIGIVVGVVVAGHAYDWAASAKQQEAASHAASNPAACWPLPAHTLPGRSR